VKNLLGLPITINQNVNFDYLNVDDCVMIIEKFLSIDPRHKAYNIVTGTTIDLVTIANKINNISGNKSKIIVKNSGLNVEYSGDNKRLLEEINFKFTPFDVALKKLYNYYRSIIGTIDKKKIETDEYIKFCKTNK
jgi:GDP-L-fucose synthase